LPARFQNSRNPVGGLIVSVVAEEFVVMQPTSIAFGALVVTSGIVPLVALAPDADWGVPSIGEDELTPA
jgi:hypothetical protein